MPESVKKGLLAVGVLVVGATSSFGAVVPADFAIDTADIGTIAGAMLTALGVIWIARRVIGFMGR